MGKILGVVAIKGGVGKTTIALNLGVALAQEFRKRVLVVDANFSAPNLGLHLGVVQPEKTIQDVLKDRVSLAKAIVHHDIGVDLLLGSLKEWRMRQPHLLKQKLEPAREWYDYIILDASPNLNNEVFATMLASDELLLVTTADYPTLSCTMHAAKVAKRRNTPVLGIVLNRSRDQKFELATSEIEDATGVPVIATLPDDIRVLEALAHTQPAAVYAPRRDVSIAYRQLAAQLAGEEYEDPRLLSRIRNFFSTLTRSKGEKKPRHAS